MAVKVIFTGEDGVKNYDDGEVRFAYAFGPGGILYVVGGESNIDRYEILDVYGPMAWWKVSGDIYDDGTLSRLGYTPVPR